MQDNGATGRRCYSADHLGKGNLAGDRKRESKFSITQIISKENKLSARQERAVFLLSTRVKIRDDAKLLCTACLSSAHLIDNLLRLHRRNVSLNRARIS